MRPRRQALQVSTFPFLAVLLCAMGSLILLLLVIDRRAKAVARAKALQIVERRAADESASVARHRAEFERRRQTLHDDMKNHASQFLERIHAVRSQAAAVTTSRKEEEARREGLEQKVQALEAQITEKKQTLKAREAKFADVIPSDREYERERSRMTEELVRLEKALADVRAIRSRDDQTYSLVPYKGKRGDNRRPIYVECNATDLLLHPQRRALDISGLRAELENRKDIGAGDEKPYVLFLVRPAGILTYYRTMAALESMDVNFGYEFVEPEWAFDFSESDPPTPEKALATQKVQTASPIGTPSSKSIESSGPLLEPRPASIAAPEGWTSGSAATGLRTNAVGAKARVTGPFLGHGESRTIASAGPSAVAPVPLQTGNSVVASTQPSAFQPRATAIALPSEPNQHGGGSAHFSGQPELIGGGTNPAVQAGNAVSLTVDGAGLPSSVGGVPSNKQPPGSAVTSPTKKPSVSATQPATTGQPTQTGNGTTQLSGRPNQPIGEPNGNGERPASPLLDSQAPASGRTVKLPPSRDWIVTVECTADGVIVSPGALRFPLEVQTPGAMENPVLQTVRQMIQRRQSMARPDEPTVRPVIHFRIRPEGLRAYHMIYPTLGTLRVPMTRESLQPDIDSRPRRAGVP